MRIGFLGNFLVPYSTETHCAKTLGAMGHRVQCLQETVATAGQIAKATQECDLFIWTHTHGWHTPDIEVAFANAIARGRIPIITYHLDLWHGLGRERDMHTDPYWKVLTDFFTVDARMADWLNANTKIKGHYLPAGVFDQECYMAPPDNDRFDVCFVGSRRYHPEWPYRPKLIDWLENTYKGRFRLYGQDGLGVRRGEALNQIYANSRVVVGDTLCLGYTYPDYWCVDDQTSILTADGWKTVDTLAVGDQAYTIKPDTLQGEWNPVEAVSVFGPAVKEMLSLRGERHDSLTTKNHRWLVRSASTQRLSDGRIGRLNILRFKESQNLNERDSIPLSAPLSEHRTVSPYSDAFVELVAWAWTEGSCRNGRYESISQSHHANPLYVDRINAALTQEYGPPVSSLRAIRGQHRKAWRVASPREGMTQFGLSKALAEDLGLVAPDHRPLPSFINSLTESQLRLFVETSVDADGCRKGRAVTFAQKDVSRLDGFELACALLGIATSRTEGSGCTLIHLKKRDFTAPLRAAVEGTAKAEVIVHDGRVWCPTTKNHTWLAMRNGKVFFTGNSDRIYETTGRGGFLIHPRIEGISTQFVDGEEVVFYDYDNFPQLKSLIDYYLANPEEREAIRKAGHERTKNEHTYAARWATILKTLGMT